MNEARTRNTSSALLTRVQRLLAAGVKAVVAPQSGGCARHVLSQRVDCEADRSGAPLFALDGSNASSLRLLTESTVTLQLDVPGHEGEEFHLTGRLSPTDDGRYRLHIIRAYHVHASGEKRPIGIPMAE